MAPAGEGEIFIIGASGLTSSNTDETAANDPKRKPNLKIVEGDVTDVASPSGCKGWAVVVNIRYSVLHWLPDALPIVDNR